MGYKLPAEPPNPVIARCPTCGNEFYRGDYALQDGYYDHDYFCDRECFRKHARKNFDDYFDVLMDKAKLTEVGE
jgi:hypothetical protein